MSDLNQRQRMFCLLYAGGLSVENAYIGAGYKARGAKHNGHHLKAREEVAAEIRRCEDELLLEAGVQAVQTLREIADIAFADPLKVFREVGRGKSRRLELLSIDDMPERERAAIKSVRHTRYGVQVEFHSKTAALEKLMRHLGLYERDNEQVTGNFTFTFGAAGSPPVHEESAIEDPSE